MTPDSTNGPLVSVVIATYNRSKYVVEAVESALAQTYRNIEVVVVNDGSSDDTAEALMRFGAPVVVINRANGGAASARNEAIRASKGELIGFLDDDDRWQPHKLALQVPHFQDREVSLVHTGARFIDEASGWDKTQYIGDIDFHDLLASRVLYGQTAVVRRSVLDEVGLFDERDFAYVADLELWLRIAAAHRLKGIEQCTAEVRCHEVAMHSNIEKMFETTMAVLDRYSTAHKNCSKCAAALKEGRRYVRVYAYEECKKRSRSARDKHAYGEAVRQRLAAFRYDPGAFALLPVNAAKKLMRRPAG